MGKTSIGCSEETKDRLAQHKAVPWDEFLNVLLDAYLEHASGGSDGPVELTDAQEQALVSDISRALSDDLPNPIARKVIENLPHS